MKNVGFIAPEILLPNGVDLTAFACIACDQFTSEKEYWNELERITAGKKTMLDLVLPEIYLEDNADKRIQKINQNINAYLNEGVFKQLQNGFVLTIRSTPYVKKRIGLVSAVDLECYNYSKKSDALIRATEGTIEERIPPRLKIRKDAPIEFPHIMVLFDDERREINEQLYDKRQELEKLYDFELNMGGGHVEGYFVPDSQALKDKFGALLDSERLIQKYGKEDKFLFAVGDGNHSLATAKTHWENVKKNLTEEQRESHPARYALCELVNIYDEGIYFEPIHRLVTGVNVEEFIKGLNKIDGGVMNIYASGNMRAQNGKNALAQGISAVDEYIKNYITANGGVVDYIHGEENIKGLVDGNDNAVGILFESLDKKELFRYVSAFGAFPRKTFSMGEGIEKRYYIEGKKIVK